MDNTSVVIVGGGAVGCATAYYLARAGIETTLIESNSIANGASGYAMGLLNPVSGTGIPGAWEELSRTGFLLHGGLSNELKEVTGSTYIVRSCESIHLAYTDEDVAALEVVARCSDNVDGISCRWLDGREVKSLEGRVSEGALKALLLEGTLLVESYDYTKALAQGAERHGALIRYAKALGIKRSGSKLEVVLDDGSIEGDNVVLAMGPWTQVAREWLGISIPVYPLKGQILRLDLAGRPLERSIHHRDNYIGSKPDGLVWVGTTEESVGYDDRSTDDAKAKIIREVGMFFPSVEQGRVMRHTACLRPVTTDGLPILGQVSSWNGVYLATGAGRKGILVSPAMGRATADLITTGISQLSIDSFSPNRFSQHLDTTKFAP